MSIPKLTLAIIGARLPEEWRECTCDRGEVAAATDGFSRSSIDDTGRLGTRDIGPNGSAPGSTLAKVAAWLLAKAESLECSGVSAGWCPVHGDCTCPSWNKRCEAARETIMDAATELRIPWEKVKGVDLLARIDDDEVERNDPSCPLHRPGSAHAGIYDGRLTPTARPGHAEACTSTSTDPCDNPIRCRRPSGHDSWHRHGDLYWDEHGTTYTWGEETSEGPIIPVVPDDEITASCAASPRP